MPSFFSSSDKKDIQLGIPKPTGEDAPAGFTKNEVTIFKGYFCKYICQKEWDNFHEEEVFMNEELRNNARAVFNEKSFHKALYDNDADYARLARYVLNCLVSRGLLSEEKHAGKDSTYWRTDKLNDLCPEILKYTLPVIDGMIDEYDRQHHQQ
jgi:hypothetical protein